MPEWMSYELVDFLMFSPATYYRMIELYHGSLWPLHLLIFAIIIFLLVKWRQPPGKSVILLFACAWLPVGVAFFYYQFAPIFWGAYYIAAAFVVQALLLVATIFLKYDSVEGRKQVWKLPVYFMAAVALVAPPLLTMASGRPLATSDLVFATPDPTVVATFSLLCTFRSPWWLFPIPILWSVFSGLLLYAMETPWFWLMPVISALAVAGRLISFKLGRAAD